MKMTSRRVKIFVLLVFLGFAVVVLTKDDRLMPTTAAFSTGPPPGHTGAPGEVTCTNCHIHIPGAGQFIITQPQNYTLGQTYQIVVRHVSGDPTRLRWGFELTALAGTSMAGSFGNTSGNTQIITGAGEREYIEHTVSGTFANQAGGAVWTFNWTAPAANVGEVTFYAAGNQANNDGLSEGDRIFTTTATSQPPPSTPSPRALFDFDGDNKTDVSIFRPGPAEWWILRSSDNGNNAAQFGSTTDRMTPADFTGDGKADIAFFRSSTGEWFVLRSEDFSFFAFPFGTNGDIPAPANYDGDGKTDPAVFRPSSASWFVLRSSDGGVTSLQFGISADLPVPADYDSDGKADIAVWRPGPGEWWILKSAGGILALQFGSSTDKAVPGDYTGDGKADVAFFRPSTGQWFVVRSEDFSFFGFPFGTSGDIPTPGDYDGDGKTDAAVYRPSNSAWFVNKSTGGVLSLNFGIPGDEPLPGSYVR